MDGHDKQNLVDSLSLIMPDMGVMQKLHNDNANEMVIRKTPLFKRVRKEGIDFTNIEPNRPDENYGENIVGQAKLGAIKIMAQKLFTLKLWCYSL